MRLKNRFQMVQTPIQVLAFQPSRHHCSMEAEGACSNPVKAAVLQNLRVTCFPKRDAQHHLRRPGLNAVLYSLRCAGVIVMRSRCFQTAVPRCSDAASWSQLLATLTESAARAADITIVKNSCTSCRPYHHETFLTSVFCPASFLELGCPCSFSIH